LGFLRCGGLEPESRSESGGDPEPEPESESGSSQIEHVFTCRELVATEHNDPATAPCAGGAFTHAVSDLTVVEQAANHDLSAAGLFNATTDHATTHQ
jgi:hypothetical protein